MTPDITSILKEWNAAKTRKKNWENLYELVARYVHTRKQGFQQQFAPGDFLTHGDVYDSTAIRANNIMASSLIGSLWKNGARTFRLTRPRQIVETQEVKDYYAEINRRMTYHMEHQKAGLEVALQEYMADQGSFGTSAIGVFPAKPGSENLLEFKAFSVKYMTICEGASGYVTKVWIETEMNAFQLVEEYGEAALFDKAVADAYKATDYEKKFLVVWHIRPRARYIPNKKDKANLPVETIHILVSGSESGKFLLKHDGFRQMPVKVARFYKNQDEEYGRSPAMEALPDIIELNAIWEMITKAAEKQLHPPLYLLDDGTFGNGTIDTSPGAFNVLDVSSRIANTAPIGVIGTVGELNSSLKMVEQLVNQIMSHFFVDRLLDLNNQTKMTLGEANIRNELRSESLGSIFSRQLNELFTPLADTSFNTLFDMGELGVLPGSDEEKMLKAVGKTPLYIPEPVAEALLAGQDIYEIQYISPAARMLRSEEQRGLLSVWQFATTYAQLIPEMMIRLDPKRSIELMSDLSGAPEGILVSEELFKQNMEAYRQAQAVQQQQMMANQEADTMQKEAAAKQQNAQAQATR